MKIEERQNGVPDVYQTICHIAMLDFLQLIYVKKNVKGGSIYLRLQFQRL